MIKTKSIYECPVNKEHTIRAEPAQKITCPHCHVQMVEVTKGYITKGR